MAERRMFAKTIIDSDAFLDMPLSTQALYFHLSMRADDDGFINKPKVIMRMCNCTNDDMKLLVAKKFIIPFESGIVVIKHWKIHNYIRKDAYTETKYKVEKSTLSLDENSAYTQRRNVSVTESLQDCNVSVTESLQDCNVSLTQDRLGKDRLGKVSIGKDRLGDCKGDEPPTPIKKFIPPDVQDVKAYCIERKNNVDPQRFVDYYESNGWKVGRNKMKDWKAAVRTWERDSYKRPEKKHSVDRLLDIWSEVKDE